MWHLCQNSVITFPNFSIFMKDDDCAKMAPYGVISEGHVYGLFVPFPTPVLIGFNQDAIISLEAGLGQNVFLSVVFDGFHSRYQSTLIPVPPSIRPS